VPKGDLTRALRFSARREEIAMAARPLAFGVRMNDKSRGRTVRVLQSQRDPRRYLVQDSRRGGKTRQREHASLSGALRDLARTWRQRLH
jgi:hypothetical protein